MTETDWSVPETEVLSRIGAAIDDGRDAVLATVVDVEGSAYRRPGAKMLIEGEESAGSITAGCLEDEVRAVAADVRAAGQPRIERYDLTGEDDVWGLGVGCNGMITVLLEPLTEGYRPVVERVAAHEDVGVLTIIGGDDSIVGSDHPVVKGGASATASDSDADDSDGSDTGTDDHHTDTADCQIGARAYYTPPEEGFSGDLPAWVYDDVAERTAELVEHGQAETVRVESPEPKSDTDRGSVEVFVDGIEAPPHLIVFGSGPDVGPVVDLAKRVEFRVTVASFRGARASAERFPRADQVLATSPVEIRERVAFDADTYAVVMTHNFLDDQVVLAELLETPVPYVGLMGPRERFEELRDALAAEGVDLDESALDRVYTPIGLDLGGDSPGQIAHGIVSEVLAVANDRTPEHLSARGGPIHERVERESSDRDRPLGE